MHFRKDTTEFRVIDTQNFFDGFVRAQKSCNSLIVATDLYEDMRAKESVNYDD
jgi:hypothetical protein